jgi:hypothetical protein
MAPHHPHLKAGEYAAKIRRKPQPQQVTWHSSDTDATLFSSYRKKKLHTILHKQGEISHIYPYNVLKYLGACNSKSMFLPIKTAVIHIYPQNVKNIHILCFYINEELFLKMVLER